MKITTAALKALLAILFYEKTGQMDSQGRPIHQPVQFPFDKLIDAASAAKKLNKGSAVLEDGRTLYSKGTVEFTPAEASVLNDLFDKHRDQWDVTVADAVMELQKIFHSEEEAEVKPSRAERRRKSRG